MPESQLIINMVFGAFMAALGWVLKTLWSAISELQKADTNLVDKVAKIEILVAGEYVKADRFDQMMNAVFTKLDRIEEKLSQKADR